MRTIEGEALTTVPGTRGDVLRAIEVLPGVGRPAFGAGDLIIRGSAPGDSQVFVEGVPLPLLYHFGGLTSTLSSRLVDRIDFMPGNFSVRYGRKMGGVVEVDLRDPARDGFHGVLELGAIDASAVAEFPLGENASAAFGVRRSTMDLYIRSVLPDDVGLVAAPVYYDYQTMVSYQPSSKDRLRFMFYGANDRFAIDFDDAVGEEPQVRGNAGLTTRFNHLQLGWRHDFDSRTRLNVDVLAASWQTDVVLGESFDLDIDIWHTTQRIELRHRATNRFTITAGIDADVEPVTYLGPPLGQDEGNPSGPDIGDDPLAGDVKVVGVQPGVYLEMDVRPVAAWQLIVGARGDYDHQTQSFAFDPRLTSIVHVHDRARLKVGAGLFSQPAAWEYATPEAGGNDELRWQHALHTGVGAEWDITEGVRVGVEGFYKHLWDRVVAVPGGLEPGFVNEGIGRINGMEFSARANRRHGYAYVSYTLSRSERRDHPDDPNDEWRLFDYDQTHIFTLAGVARLPRGWQLGGTLRLVSGNPVSAPRGAVLDVDDLRYHVVYDALNTERSPLFHRLDVRVEKKWTFEDWSLAAFLDIQNVYNQQNEEGRAYNYDASESEPIRGLPILPAIGVRGEI